jgi:uncharacterized heparinase superfamily protein
MRWFHTVRHLRPIQVRDRIARKVRRPRARNFAEVALREPVTPFVLPIAHEPGLTPDGDFVALNERHSLATAAGWNLPAATRLWRYHAHYFDDLVATGHASRAEVVALMRRWIEENPVGQGPGWEPYPLSRRIVNWIKWSLAGNELTQPIRASLAVQADMLSQSIERHLLGNHLLANGKALFFAGTVLVCDRSARWSELGQELLSSQLREQVLADGAHQEASPMYHAIVLEDLLDVVNLARAFAVAGLDALPEVARRMLDWLATMTHPDGGFALFNDAALDGAAPFEALRLYAGRLGLGPTAPRLGGMTWLPASGYGRLALGPAVVLVDAGPLGPAHQPGHAHADTLSFELSLFGRRVVVDTGTSTYEAGAQRTLERGTAAHNTVTVDARDSSDVWHAFRVGRRANVSLHAARDDGSTLLVSASHGGYARGTHPVRHQREWLLGAESLEVRDRMDGRGEHRFASALHFHPDLDVVAVGQNLFEVTPAARDWCLRVSTDPHGDSRIEPATYHPRFGVSLPNRRIVTRHRLRAPCGFETRLEWCGSR